MLVLEFQKIEKMIFLTLPNMRAIFWFKTFFSSVNLFCSRNFLVLSSTAADATLVSFGIFFSSDSFSSDSFSSSSSLKRRKVYLKMYNSVDRVVVKVSNIFIGLKKTCLGLFERCDSIEDISRVINL